MANNNPEQHDSGASSASTTTGQADTSEAASMTTANSSAPRRSTSETRKPSSQAPTPTTAAPPPLRKQLSGGLVTTPSASAGTSPRTSRNASPVRKDSRPQPLTTPISTQPSAAAIQRALSAANVPALQGGSTNEAGRPSRQNKSTGASGETTPQWPISPRLKSPPPSGPNSRRGSTTTAKKAEAPVAAPTINVQNATPQSTTPPPPPTRQPSDEVARAPQLQTPAKGPSRGPSGKSTLETVQENSTDDVKEPSPAAVRATADLKPLTKISDEENQARKESNGQSEKPQPESGSESAGKAEGKKTQPPSSQPARPKNTHTKSFTPLASAKSRQADGKQGMTVETETVPSIPQSAIGTGDRSAGTRNDGSGTVRSKLSTETIRPKKERKKPTQKARSLNQGTGTQHRRSPFLTSQEFQTSPIKHNSSDSGSSRSSSTAREPSSEVDSPRSQRRDSSHSQHQQLHRKLSFRKPSNYFRTLSDKYLRKASSKADIFEARVANAVEDANSSDSDETFVYESNPPEPQRRRHHSRTPSVASQHSAVDGQRAGIRNVGDMMDERRVAGKRSMKFSNNPYNDPDTPEGKDGSVRSHTPRHFGRFGRGGSHQSMFDQDSPFTQASKLRTGHFSGVRGSRPNSPRSPQQASGQGTPRSTGGLFGRNKEPSYDFDAEGAADDERTPLVGTVRTPRRYPRRINSSNTGSGSIDEYYGVRRQSRCRRLGGAVLGICIFAVVVLSAIAFLVLSNRPMYDVQLERIENVLASEEELMLDLVVGAVNPNALGITVEKVDVNIFAKSRFVGSGAYWRRHGLEGVGEGSVVKRRKRRRRRDAELEAARMEDPDDELPHGWQDLSSHWHAPSPPPLPSPADNRDDGTSPSPDPDAPTDTQTMLLGRISTLDTPLTFLGSPLKRHLHHSTGGVRLEKPGNLTETGGSERWEEVLGHEFELIVRGVLRYGLPVGGWGGRAVGVGVGGSLVVRPSDGVDGDGGGDVDGDDGDNGDGEGKRRSVDVAVEWKTVVRRGE